MRFTLSTTCLLAVLASSANARPATRRLQARQLLGISIGVSGPEEGQDQSAETSDPASASLDVLSEAAPAGSASASATASGSPSYDSSAVSSTSSSDYVASPTASSSLLASDSASPIPISSPDISSLSSAANSELSSASATAAASSLSSERISTETSVSATVSATPTSTSASESSESSTSASASARSSESASASRFANGCGAAPGDAPYTLSCGDLSSVITFPNGFRNRPGGIVFLVHGTGSTGEETWGPGPYNTILPNKGPGYDIAWFTSPTRSLGDAQVTAEYIAYNIKRLADMSATKKVFIIGHSQGNINIQWALAFWPSMRQYVTGFSSLAGDFHGTAEGPLVCTAQDLLQGGCEPSVIQQSVGSNYLQAQNSAGGYALVPTTSIYTIFDDIIQPEIINPTSELPGALNLRIQDLDLCGSGYVIDHFLMTVAAGPFYLTLSALENNGVADRSAFTLNECTYLLTDSTIPNPFATVPGVIKQIALDAISVVVYEPKVPAEPRLMPYVCERGASGYC